MKAKLLCLAMLFLSAAPVSAADYSSALGAFRGRLRSFELDGARVAPGNRLVLEVRDFYLTIRPAARANYMRDIMQAWSEDLVEQGIKARNLAAMATWADGGEVWFLKSGRISRVAGWSDRGLGSGERQPARDSFFGFIGGQVSTGGDYQMSGLNTRLGKTFFGGRCDLALTYGYSSVNTEPRLTNSSYGFTGRVLFRSTKSIGWNVGAGVVRSSPSAGEPVTSSSLLGGLNFYLPGGSIDTTLSMGNNSTYGLLVGYTARFSRK